MLSVQLQQNRCPQCGKLLFKGTIGMGLIEVKCARCGTVSILHSFDTFLHGRSNVYVIVYTTSGDIIAASKSSEAILERAVTNDHSILDIQPDIHLVKPPEGNQALSFEALERWQRAYETMPHTAKHRKGSGETIEVSARYYPVPAYLNMYTVGVFSLSE